jgi:hypothetical protein
VFLMNSAEIAEEFSKEPNTAVLHYFVNSDHVDPEVTGHVGGLDPCIDEPTSIMNFSTLPTITRQRHTKFKDPIFDFAQSKILTFDEYSITVEELRLAKEMAQRAKQQQRHEKEDSRRRKVVQWEEWRVAKTATREEAIRLKEMRATEQAELQAVREEAQCARAQRLADAAAAKATERARKALERQEQQRLQAARAAKMAHGRQGGKRSEDAIAGEPKVPRTHISSSISGTPKHPYFFSASHGFPPMTSSADLSFPQLNTPMQSMQPAHLIL